MDLKNLEGMCKMDKNAIRQENPELNDGLLEYGKIKTLRDDATAKKTGEGFEKIGSLYFSYQTINARFDSYHVSSLSTVDLKIRCFYVVDFKETMKIKINNDFYEVEGYDTDNKKVYMYLFLRKVGYFDGGSYIETT